MSLRVEGLRIKISDFEIKADFEIRNPEILGLRGESGSGKTTLMRAIAGLQEVEEGKVILNERDISNLPPEKRRIGFVFQDLGLFTTMNVLENIGFGLRMQGVSKREREKESLFWLSRLGLKDFADRSVEKLSGGEKQRVALLRALLSKPELLLLDEPFTGLNAELKNQIKKDLLELLSERKIPVLLVSHDEEDLQSLCSRKLMISVTNQRFRVVQ